MRYLFVTIGYSPFRGGAATYTQGVAGRLVKEGHEATVYTTDIGEIEHLWTKGKRHLPWGEEVIRGVHVERFQVRHLPFSPLSYRAIQRLTLNLSHLPLPVTSLLWRLSQYTPWVPGLQRRLDTCSERVDLVHGLGLLFGSLLAPAFSYARRMNVPFVVTPQLHLGGEKGGTPQAFHTMSHQMSLLGESDALIAQTSYERDFLAAQGISGERIHVIGPGVNLEAFVGGDPCRFREKYGLARPFAFYLGTLSFDKGAVHTLEAMRSLWKQGADLDLVLAGPPMDHFLRHYDSLPASEQARCHLVGPISEEDKSDLLAASEMLVLPSRSESFGIVYLEAWAARKPVVGASVGCVPEVITHGQDGYLVPFGDVQAIAEAILALWRDEKERRRLGESGYSKALRNYSWQVIYNQIKGLYKSLMEG